MLIEAREELAQGDRGGGLRGCRDRERRPQQPCVRHALDHWNARLWRYLQGPLSGGSEQTCKPCVRRKEASLNVRARRGLDAALRLEQRQAFRRGWPERLGPFLGGPRG